MINSSSYHIHCVVISIHIPVAFTTREWAKCKLIIKCLMLLGRMVYIKGGWCGSVSKPDLYFANV